MLTAFLPAVSLALGLFDNPRPDAAAGDDGPDAAGGGLRCRGLHVGHFGNAVRHQVAARRPGRDLLRGRFGMATDTVSFLPEMRAVPLAWRNLVSSKLRLVRSIAGIGFAVLLMLVQLGFERGFFDASLGILARDRRRSVHHARKQISLRQRGPVPGGQPDADASNRRGCERRAALRRWQHFLWKEPNGEKTYLCRPSGSIRIIRFSCCPSCGNRATACMNWMR